VTVYGKNFSQWDKIEVSYMHRSDPNAPDFDLVAKVATNVTDASFDIVVSSIAVTGSVRILSSNVGGGSSLVQTPFPLKVPELVTITSVVPDRVRRITAPQPGVFVTPQSPVEVITGQGFLKQPGAAVYFTGTSGMQDQLGSIMTKRDAEILVIVPAGARTGKLKVVVGTGAATETVMSSTALTVMEPMEVTAINPASAMRGSKVTITGKGFLNRSALTVNFNFMGSPAEATVLRKTDTVIDVTVPGLARGSQQVDVMVMDAGAQESESKASAMRFTALPTPLSLDTFTPATGAPGTSVTLTGYGHENPIVNFANNVRATVVSTAEGAMTAKGPLSVTRVTVPPGAVTGPITVITAEGSVASRSIFTIPTYKVALTDFQPDVGTVGTVITFTGTFDPVAANNVVTFIGAGQVPAVTAVPMSGTGVSLQVKVPAGARTGTVSVGSAGGQASMPKAFSLPPSITSFSIPGGPVGYDIDINGDNFNQVTPQSTVVKFNGTVATSVRVWSGTVIKVTIPAGATTGKVTVQTPGGLATSPTVFTVR
jgi:hypothetical protein